MVSAFVECMTPQELRERTAAFAVDIARLIKSIDSQPAARVAIDQLIRSATSTAANYRAAGLARSHREFISKMSQVLEEADESLHWLEFMRDAEVADNERLTPLIREARELTRIFGASKRTALMNAANQRKPKAPR